MELSRLSGFAFSLSDNENIRLEKRAAILVCGACCIAGLGWAVMYYFIFGLKITTLLPLMFVVIVGIAIAIAHYTKNHYWAVYTQIICIIYITAFIQWSIGGVFDSGFVLAWAFCGPITALTFFSLRQSFFWFCLYIVNILITVCFNGYFASKALPVSETIKTFFFIMNLGVSSLVVFIFALFFVSNTMKERERADNLLLNILPADIANLLKSNTGTIARRHEMVCVLFADIVEFTKYSSMVSPEVLVSKLDAIFKEFDTLADKYKLEKIKTIGDAYMVVGGIPVETENYIINVANMALEMQERISNVKKDGDTKFTIKIGIHCGPVVAGVIGHKKFAYDLWGDTVNIASRMESSCEEGKIQISSNMKLALEEKFDLRKRGEIEIKGKGFMETYYLLSKK